MTAVVCVDPWDHSVAWPTKSRVLPAKYRHACLHTSVPERGLREAHKNLVLEPVIFNSCPHTGSCSAASLLPTDLTCQFVFSLKLKVSMCSEDSELALTSSTSSGQGFKLASFTSLLS